MSAIHDRSARASKSRKVFAAAIDRLEPRRLLCGIPHQPIIDPPVWSDAIEQQYTSAHRGGPEAVSIVWSNRGQASDNFASTFGTSANAGRLVVDAALRHWERVITNFNRSDGSTTLQVNVSIAGANVYGGAGSPAATAPADGKPRTGSFTLTPGVATPNANDSNGWYFDATPDDWAEFNGGIVNAYAANSSTALGSDFYTIAVAEMAHVLGLISDKNNDGTSWNGYRLETSGFVTPTGIRDNAEGGGNFGYFSVFDGPNVDHLMTSYNGGDATDASWGNVIHTAGGGGNINFNSVNWRGAEDGGNAASNERDIPSWTVAQILADAYGYTIADPEQFGTMYASLNQSTGLLTIRGSDSATSSDLIILDQVGQNLRVTVDIGEDVPGTGPLPGAGNIDGYVSLFPASSINSIVINSGGGTDYIRIESSAGRPVQVNPEAGDDFIDFGFYSRNLGNNATANISINGGPGFDQVFCYDNSVSTAQTYTITNARFDRPAWGGFAYSADIEALSLVTGTAADTVNVQSTFSNQPISLNSAGGQDTVNIGRSSDGIRGINANVTINNDPSFTTLNINNGADTGARTWNVDAVNNFGYIIGMAQANIYWDNADIGSINLTCGSGVDTGQFVISTETFNVNNSGGNDFITVGVPAAGGLQLISGQITIDNGPALTTLTLDDNGDTTNRNVIVDEAGGYNTVAGLSPSGLIRFDSFDVNSATIITGSGNDSVSVPRNDEVLNIVNLGGLDGVTIGNATNGVQSISSAVSISSPFSPILLTIHDGPDTTARTATLQNAIVNGSTYSEWAGLAPAPIRYKDQLSATVTFGTGADTIAVRQTQGDLNLSSTGGVDTYTIGGASNGAQSVLGNITLTNPPDHNIITLSDVGDTVGRTATLDDVTISGAPYGRLTGLAPATINWKYNDTTSINITHGSGADSLAVKRHQKPLTIQGTAGADTVTLGGVAGIGMNGITASTTVLNTSGATTLILNDSTDTTTSPSTLIHEMNTLLLGRVTGMSPAPVDYRFGQVNTVRLRTSQGGPNNVIVIHETSPLTRVFYDPGAAFETIYVNDDSIGSAALYTDRSVHPNTAYIFDGAAIYQQPGKFVFRSTVQVLSSGVLDLSDGAMIYDYDEGNPIGGIQEKINSGRNGGNWLGFGIRSSTAAANPKHNTTLGAMTGSDYIAMRGTTQFNGNTIDDTTVLVKYTYYGDTDFNGVVNFDDYSRIDAGFNFGRTGWVNGDFDGNGSVNFDDYSLIDLAFNTQGSALRLSSPAAGPKGLKVL
ncbi:hypothetical protein BH09PLA1_BH09PLA1_02220 [soil metagenome]